MSNGAGDIAKPGIYEESLAMGSGLPDQRTWSMETPVPIGVCVPAFPVAYPCPVRCKVNPVGSQTQRLHIHTNLSNLFNLSLQTGQFPNKMKIAKIVPLYKTGDKHTNLMYVIH